MYIHTCLTWSYAGLQNSQQGHVEILHTYLKSFWSDKMIETWTLCCFVDTNNEEGPNVNDLLGAMAQEFPWLSLALWLIWIE